MNSLYNMLAKNQSLFLMPSGILC